MSDVKTRIRQIYKAIYESECKAESYKDLRQNEKYINEGNYQISLYEELKQLEDENPEIYN